MSDLGRWARRHPYLATIVAGGGALWLLDKLFAGGGPRRVLVPTVGHVYPRGPEYVAAKMPYFERGDTCGFVRYARALLAGLGLTGRPADLLIAHVGRETGFGHAVYDFNFHNIRAFATTDAPWSRYPNGYPYRAYLSAAEGMRAGIDVIARPGGRYARAWQMLQAGDANWYSQLGLAGYYEVDGRPMTQADVPREQADYLRALGPVLQCA